MGNTLHQDHGLKKTREESASRNGRNKEETIQVAFVSFLEHFREKVKASTMTNTDRQRETFAFRSKIDPRHIESRNVEREHTRNNKITIRFLQSTEYYCLEFGFTGVFGASFVGSL